MAQSLIKKLDKIDRIEVDEDDNAVMSLNFPISVTPGKVVVEAENVAKNYGDNQVLKGVNKVRLHLSDRMVKVNRLWLR